MKSSSCRCSRQTSPRRPRPNPTPRGGWRHGDRPKAPADRRAYNVWAAGSYTSDSPAAEEHRRAAQQAYRDEIAAGRPAPGGRFGKRRARKNPSDEFPWVRFSAFIVPDSRAKFLRVVAERAPASYPVSAWGHSEDAKVMRRRKVPQTGVDHRGAPRFEIGRARLPRLLLALANSAREDEQSLAAGIASTLNIELV